MHIRPRDSSIHWFALTVKPQHEKTAAAALQNKGVKNFLPLYRSKRRWSDRMKELELPLFPGYVFGQFPFENRLSVLTTPGVTSIVSFGKMPAPVEDTEIAAVQSMVHSGLPIGPWPFVKVGQNVRIVDGPLAGIEGILIQEKNACRVVVSILLLQRSVAVEIERERLRPVTRKPMSAHA